MLGRLFFGLRRAQVQSASYTWRCSCGYFRRPIGIFATAAACCLGVLPACADLEEEQEQGVIDALFERKVEAGEVVIR